MGQWFLQWGWALALLIVAVSFVMMWYRSSVDAWGRAGGDWKKALALEVGPFITFAVKVSVGAMVMTWAVMYVYGVGQGSPIAQSFYQLGTAGVSALSGTFGDVQVNIPSAPALTDVLVNNIPTEADLRNVLTGASTEQQSAPVTDESVQAVQQSTWTAPASAPDKLPLVMAPAIINGDVKPYAPPAVPLVLQSAADKTPVAAPTSIPFIFKAAGNGGGPLAADADAAIAQAGATTYTVKRGDYLSKIASQVGVPASVICRTNRLPDCNTLRTGTVLTIPAK